MQAGRLDTGGQPQWGSAEVTGRACRGESDVGDDVGLVIPAEVHVSIVVIGLVGAGDQIGLRGHEVISDDQQTLMGKADG